MANKEVKKTVDFNLDPVDIPAVTSIDKNGFYCCKRTQQKCDSHYVRQYVEVPPLAIDEKTGEVINKTLVPVIKEVEPKNFYDEIQSFKDDCDVYSILAKFQKTGDISVLNAANKTFADYYNIPDNINDFNNLVKKSKEELKKYSVEQRKIIEEGNDEAVNNLVAQIVKAQLVKQGLIKEAEKAEEVK